MQDTFEVNAQARSDMGKGASRRLRRAGKVPGIIYGGGKDPEMITAMAHELDKHLAHEAFYSHILTVNMPSGKQKVVLKDVQRHPAKPLIMHFDLLRVLASEKIRMQVPLHFVGEAKAVGVKMGGVATHHMSDVEVSCLPGDLPEYIELDVSALDIGDALHLTDISLPAGVELTALQQGTENDVIVVSITVVREEPEEGEEVEAGEAGAELGEGSAESEEDSAEES